MKLKSHYAAYSPCKSVYRELLKAHIDKELSATVKHMVSLHINKCFSCRTEYNSLKLLSLSLKAVTKENPSPSLRERILMAAPQTTFVHHKPSRVKSLSKMGVLASFTATAAFAAVIIPTLHNKFSTASHARLHTSVNSTISNSNPVPIQSKPSLQIASSIDPFNPHYLMQGYKPAHPVNRQHGERNRSNRNVPTLQSENMLSTNSNSQQMERYLMETSNANQTKTQISQWIAESGGNLEQIAVHKQSEDLIYTINRRSLPAVKHALRDILSGIQPPVGYSKLKNTATIHHMTMDGAMTPAVKSIPDNDEIYIMIRLAKPPVKQKNQE